MKTSASNTPTPDLFLVGAPKCGTTSMYEYLRQHPQIFFPYDDDDYWRTKEPNHLCPEIGLSEAYSIKDRKDYLGLYASSGSAVWRGDASPYYLVSELAPMAIKELCSAPRILVMLRPPVAMMRSYHQDLVRIHLEDKLDFYEALDWYERMGHQLASDGVPNEPPYRDYIGMSRFAAQVERYLELFGRDAVKIVLLEDMVSRPQQTYREILEFLDVDNTFCPELRVYNETPHQGSIERMATSIYKHTGARHVAQRLFPYAARRKFLSWIRKHETKRAEPDPRDERLRQQCADDVERLSELIGRDLSHWQPRGA